MLPDNVYPTTTPSLGPPPEADRRVPWRTWSRTRLCAMKARRGRQGVVSPGADRRGPIVTGSGEARARPLAHMGPTVTSRPGAGQGGRDARPKVDGGSGPAWHSVPGRDPRERSSERKVPNRWTRESPCRSTDQLRRYGPAVAQSICVTMGRLGSGVLSDPRVDSRSCTLTALILPQRPAGAPPPRQTGRLEAREEDEPARVPQRPGGGKMNGMHADMRYARGGCPRGLLTRYARRRPVAPIKRPLLPRCP